MRIILDLNELIKPAKLDVVGLKTGKTSDLYEQVRKGRIRSDEEGQQAFYKDNPIASDNFNRLKKGLQKTMVNSLFCTAIKPAGYLEKYFEIGKCDLASDILWKKGKASSAAQVAKEALKDALKYQMVSFAKSLSQRLMYHYAAFRPNRKKYQEYKALTEEYQVIEEWETKAESRLLELSLELRFFKTVKPEFISKINQVRAEFATVDIQTMHFKLFLLQFDLMLFKLTNNAQGIASTCQAGISYMDTLSFPLPPRSKRSFHFNMIPANILIGEYEAAQVAIDAVKQLTHRHSANWVGVHQFEIILGFYTDDLAKVATGIQHIRKSKAHQIVEEELRIYDTYLFFLSGSGKLNIGTFLNETIHYSQDKKGMNINILILQVLLLLKRGDRGGIIERAEALRMYAYRHLSKDDTTRRSEIFLRLLFLTVRHSFDWPIIEQQTAKTLAELQATPRQLSTIDIEVVPYEVLWGRVRELLG